MLEWHVARTEPMRSFVAERVLVEGGFDVFLPKVREEKRWSRGRTHESIRPLVSGYLFINFDVDVEGWQRVNDARGVVGLMYSAPEIPVRIPEAHMRPLLGTCEGDWRSRVDITYGYDVEGRVVEQRKIAGGFIPKAEAIRFKFKVGQVVRVADGPFAGFLGKVTKATFDKVKADVEIFGRNTPLEGSSTMFEPA